MKMFWGKVLVSGYINPGRFGFPRSFFQILPGIYAARNQKPPHCHGEKEKQKSLEFYKGSNTQFFSHKTQLNWLRYHIGGSLDSLGYY